MVQDPALAKVRYPFGTLRHVISKWLVGLVPIQWRAEYIHRHRPWDLDTSAIHERNALVLALVGERLALQGASVFEFGCSRGVFTGALATACGRVTAIDISETACASARERVRGAVNVTIRQADFERDAIAGPFDVVFAMDVLYFFRGRRRIERLIAKLTSLLRPGGYLVITDCRMGPTYRSAWFQRNWPFFGDAYIDMAGAHPELEEVARRPHIAQDPDYPEHIIGVLRKKS